MSLFLTFSSRLLKKMNERKSISSIVKVHTKKPKENPETSTTRTGKNLGAEKSFIALRISEAADFIDFRFTSERIADIIVDIYDD